MSKGRDREAGGGDQEIDLTLVNKLMVTRREVRGRDGRNRGWGLMSRPIIMKSEIKQNDFLNICYNLFQCIFA